MGRLDTNILFTYFDLFQFHPFTYEYLTLLVIILKSLSRDESHGIVQVGSVIKPLIVGGFDFNKQGRDHLLLLTGK